MPRVGNHGKGASYGISSGGCEARVNYRQPCGPLLGKSMVSALRADAIARQCQQRSLLTAGRGGLARESTNLRRTAGVGRPQCRCCSRGLRLWRRGLGRHGRSGRALARARDRVARVTSGPLLSSVMPPRRIRGSDGLCDFACECAEGARPAAGAAGDLQAMRRLRGGFLLWRASQYSSGRTQPGGAVMLFVDNKILRSTPSSYSNDLSV